MNFENEPQPHAPKRRDISLFEGIRTFAASVGTAALLMLSVCGLIGLPLPENAAAHAVSTSNITAEAETVRTVQLGGDVFGIKLFSDGVIVAALSEIYADGGLKCPASEAGIQPGDYILSVNGNTVETNAALSAVLSENETNTLTLRRGTETFTAQVTSVLCEGSYKAGMWVRDSAAGIGTMTFYTEDGKAFGALGHGICDADTRNVLEIRSGEPAAVSVCGIERGSSGRPGRLRGYFTGGKSLGTLTQNTELGLYGKLSAPHEGETVEVLPRGNVHTGAVQIAATIDDEGMRLFDAELERVSTDGKQETRTLVLHVTDPELLARTGGIVQGMSGSPIVQDGCLVGAVTHVLVNDPTRGYGIFAATMLKRADAVQGR